MAKTKKKEEPGRRVEGLMLVAVRPPFGGVSGSLLDLRGPWTGGLFDAWLDADDETQPVGVAAWSGTCEVMAPGGDDRPSFRWDGSWRGLSEDEWAALKNGDRPLTMTSFPPASDLLPLPVSA